MLAFLQLCETAVDLRRRPKFPAVEGTPQRPLAIFDVFDEWFQRASFEACSAVNVVF